MSYVSKKSIITALIGFLGFCQSGIAMAADTRVELVNHSAQSITQLYINRVDFYTWSEVLQGYKVIKPGERIDLSVFEVEKNCKFDFKIVMSDG